MKRLCTLTISIMMLCFFCATSVWAKEAPDEMLKRVTQEMIDALKHQDADLKKNPTHIYGIVNKIIAPYIDWSAMSGWVVGRQAWMQATDAQKQSFISEFKTLLIHTYASTLQAYDNQEVNYLPIRGGYNGKDRVQVASVIKEPGREVIHVNYRLADKGDTWKVYDISIEGVSLLKGFQSQFSNEIQQGGMDRMIQKLRQHNSKASANANS